MQRLYEARELPLNADCTEFCPYAGMRRMLGVGTYQLQEEEQQRIGKLLLYRIADDAAAGVRLQGALEKDCPGIFDMKWGALQHAAQDTQHSMDDNDGRAMLGMALADGSLTLLTIIDRTAEHSAQHDSGQRTATAENTARVDNIANGGMALSLDWSARFESSDAIVVSSSTGDIAIAAPQCGGTMAVVDGCHAHDLEVWNVAFDRFNSNVVYSGGDDAAFKAWDRRAGLQHSGPMFANKRAHDAGVCCIAPSHHAVHSSVLCTGSYDENVRLWDMRNTAAPLLQSKVGLGGGVWRLKWHPTDPTLMLAACMHNGFCIVHADAARGELRVVEEYDDQKTLAYGADWCHMPLPCQPQRGDDGAQLAQHAAADAADGGAAEEAGGTACGARDAKQSLVATCSFYDRLLHVWSPHTLASWLAA